MRAERHTLPRSMIPIIGSGRIPPQTTFFPALSAGSRRKRHRKMETVFRPESHHTRKQGIPRSSLHRIVSGIDMDPDRKQTEIQRFPSEPDRNTSYCSSRSDYKTPFPRIRSAKNQCCLGRTSTNKKSILKISNRLSHLK